MQQIAELAGVSRMAVSLALRNSPKLARTTIARIRAIADELGYRPNPMVSALMTQLRYSNHAPKQSTIAYVTAHPTKDGWRASGPFLEFFEGAKRRAESFGYEIEEWWLGESGMSPERLSEILYARNIYGLVVAPMPPGGGEIHLEWEHFAAVTIGWSMSGPTLHRASNDQYGSISLALRELAKLGYQRIGMAITAENDERVKRNWSAGMLVHQAQLAPENRVPALLTGDDFSGAFAEWFGRHRPDAVVSLDGDALKVLGELGVRAPEEVGFAHLALSAEDRAWAGINQNSELVGAAAIDLLDGQLRCNERNLPEYPRTLLIPGGWVAGPTVRKS